MKYTIILILILFCSNQEENPKSIPSDLKKIGVSDFYEPNEILRIWRFPEGGAVFEELIEIKRNGKEWKSIRYTYLLDEFSNKPEFQNLRKKQTLNLTEEQILEFTNDELLQKNVKPNKENQIFLSDMYLAEYRFDNRANYFEFFLEESGNNNSAKMNLITLLNEIITE
ncbi:hypothetical protein [Winogradskyella alexanderae]|uniref:Uncharacterized protein n=1 Tax=Winogradskyella alexanderae TaxID=2877123 RepID=A0ABS7XUQ6_9FLAO|nr:hypothetical protein [Winogradskyella alexanderae]MCA0133759.1 hypothetical protein [Winogradskyella alexanderae]